MSFLFHSFSLDSLSHTSHSVMMFVLRNEKETFLIDVFICFLFEMEIVIERDINRNLIQMQLCLEKKKDIENKSKQPKNEEK